MRRICLKLGLKCNSPIWCYQEQKKIEEIIHDEAIKSIKKYQSLIVSPTILGFDGSWSHKRNAPQCVSAFIDLSSKKIIDYHIIEKDNLWQKGNFSGFPQGMETECFQVMAKRWHKNPYITSICQDNEIDHGGILKKLNWKVNILVDPNHNFKQFKNCLRKEIKKQKNNDLLMIEESLQIHMWNLVFNTSLNQEEKKLKWFNAANHFTGDHSKCSHESSSSYEKRYAKIQNCKEEITNILISTEKYLYRSNPIVTTQTNESFHAIKALFAPKHISWKRSFRTRIEISILKWNEGNSYYRKLIQSLKLPIEDWQLEEFDKMEKEEIIRKNKQNSEETKEKRKIRRNKRKSNKSKRIIKEKKIDKESIISEKNENESSNESRNSYDSNEELICNDLGNYMYDGIFDELIETNNFEPILRAEIPEFSYKLSSSSCICGFVNLNNNCFISTALQMMLSCKAFYSKIININKYGMKQNEGNNILLELHDIFMKIERGCGPDLSNLQKILERILKGKYKIGQHFDCHEFLQTCFELLENTQASIEKTCIKLELKCSECKMDFINYEYEYFIKINCSRHCHVKNLEKELDHFFNNEIEIEKKCEYHNGISIFSGQKKISSLPNFLLILLMRYDIDGKIKDRYKIPEIINIHRIASFGEKDNIYNLKSVVCHIGNCMNSGHYICYRKTVNRWWRCDDDDLIPLHNINCTEVQRNAYILLYEK